MPKLVVLRGNSGSGKSTVSRALQKALDPQPMLIDHDIVRLKMINEKNRGEMINPGLILLMVKYGLEHGRDVILEGNMQLHVYGELMQQLNEIQPDDTTFYYFDVPLEETLMRHASKEAVDFTDEDVKRWYVPKEQNATGFANEIIIPASNSVEESVQRIAGDMRAN